MKAVGMSFFVYEPIIVTQSMWLRNAKWIDILHLALNIKQIDILHLTLNAR